MDEPAAIRSESADAGSPGPIGPVGRWRLLALLAATWLLVPLSLAVGLPDAIPSLYAMPVTAVLAGTLASSLQDALVLPALVMLLPAGFVLVEGLVSSPELIVLVDALWVALIHVVPVVIVAGGVHQAQARLG